MDSVPRITLPASEQEWEGDGKGVTRFEQAVGRRGLGKTDLAAEWSKATERHPRAAVQGEGCRRILVLGCSPLPFENERMNYAPGGRTWQFASALAGDGHRVVVACARIPGAYARPLPPVSMLERGGVLVYALDDALFFETDALEGLVEAFAPEVLVGASARPSRRACELARAEPVWVDVFGDVMAEGQAFEAEARFEALTAYRNLLVPLLLRGDAFSAVSERQRYSLLGQLGLAGRLNQATAGHDPVSVVPCCAFVEHDGSLPGTDREGSPWREDFVVLWGGGFNTWCDVETLVAGMSAAMDRSPDVRLVATGGAIEGHDESSYAKFQRLVRASPHRERFVLMGSVDSVDAARMLAFADIGVVTELPLHERELGSSGRVVGWLAHGLPVVCTTLSEIGQVVEREELGFTYRHGDADDLARAILEARGNRGKLGTMAERSRAFAGERLTPAATASPLSAWVREARRAEDHTRLNPLDVWKEHEHALRTLGNERQAWGEERAALQAAWAEEREERSRFEDNYHEVRSELGEIHLSKMWKVWTLYQSVVRTVLAPLRWVRSPRGAGGS
jgi:glycosyltransferase involved in cell wall biosynthesis